MENMSAYDDDLWDDDWDWEEPDEPQVTYRQAIERLRSLTQGRADVRIDWDGRRNLPRDDARIIFTGGSETQELRVRFASAAQLGEFTRIINSATLLADRHALWYASDHLITARLVGDYDQIHAAVARALSAQAERTPPQRR